MKVSDFDFDLPERLIAQAPLSQRDGARMLHVAAGQIQDKNVQDIVALLQPNDVLVLNQSKVIPARLFTQVGEKKVEVLLHQPILGDALYWQAFARPARKLKPGMQVDFAEGFAATIEGRTEDGQVRLRFNLPDKASVFEKLHMHGHIPLPPYIQRADNADDHLRYQTVFAKEEGSVAAPTAGLHFTNDLLGRLREKGVHIAYVTLHVGAGTFQPVKVEDTSEHQMHAEYYEVGEEAASIINAARAQGGRVVAVGTTALRTLESAAGDDGILHAAAGDTRLFITPGYPFKMVDCLLTNFHLPKSTLFMLVSAFSGLDIMQKAYQHAVNQGYRFYSYGDACFLEKYEKTVKHIR